MIADNKKAEAKAEASFSPSAAFPAKKFGMTTTSLPSGKNGSGVSLRKTIQVFSS